MSIQDYISKRFTAKPLYPDADISNSALASALTILEFNLSEEKEYKLFITRRDLINIQQVINTPIRVKVDIDETLPTDAWYLVDESSKTIVYSPGA